MELENLKLLEHKISKILDRHEEVRREKDVLKQRLEQQEVKLAHLAGQMKQFEDERSELKTRLEKILERLNGLELS